MTRLRQTVATHRFAAALLVLLALAMRLPVPAGFMPRIAEGGLTIMPCPAAMAMPHGHGGGGGHPDRRDTAATDACPFGALSAPLLAGDVPDWRGIGPVRFGFVPPQARPGAWTGSIAGLRPPPRGPPPAA